MKEVCALLLMLLLPMLHLAPSFKTPQTAPQLNAVLHLHLPDQRPTTPPPPCKCLEFPVTPTWWHRRRCRMRRRSASLQPRGALQAL